MRVSAKRTCASEFTLVELMVVLAVICILASLLLPALGSARKTVKRVVCASNMRNIYQGVAMYSMDFGGWLPPAGYNATHIYYIKDYLRLSPEKDGGDVSDAYQVVHFKTPRGVCFCPEVDIHPQSSPCWDGGSAKASLYYSNYIETMRWTGASSAPTDGCWIFSFSDPFRRMELVKNGCVLLVDLNWETVSGPVCICSQSASSAWTGSYDLLLPYQRASAPGRNHSSSSNFLFKDGRVQCFKYTGRQLFDYDYIPLY